MEGSNNMSNDRQRGLMLRKIDRDALCATALRHLRAMYPETEWVSVRPEWDYVVGTSPQDGKVYVICTEGVGWEVAFATPFIPFFSTVWKDPNGEEVGGGWGFNTPVYLSPLEVERITSEEEVDLADFVRSFGDRLEANFSLWHRTLSVKQRKAKASKR
jgi:hypothetical protein